MRNKDIDNIKSVLENKSVTCIKDKENNDIKLVDTSTPGM